MIIKPEVSRFGPLNVRTEDAWFVAATQPRKEDLAFHHLEQQGFTTFLPRFRSARQRGRHTMHRLVPIFPNYIFISFDPTDAPWRVINSTRGVRRLLGDKSRPQPVPGSFMSTLINRCEHGVIDSLVSSLEPGGVVRIISGPFTDQIAVVERLDARDRVHADPERLPQQTFLVH